MSAGGPAARTPPSAPSALGHSASVPPLSGRGPAAAAAAALRSPAAGERARCPPKPSPPKGGGRRVRAPGPAAPVGRPSYSSSSPVTPSSVSHENTSSSAVSPRSASQSGTQTPVSYQSHQIRPSDAA